MLRLKNWLRAKILAVVCILVVLFVSAEPFPAYSYNHGEGDVEKAHEWITRAAVELLRARRPDLFAILPIDSYLPDLIEGVRYADRSSKIECTWTPGGTYDCDTLHHYGKEDVIEFELGIDIGNPGNITACYYASILNDQATKFWPAGWAPDLLDLPYQDAGYHTSLFDSETSLGGFHVGGLPFCDESTDAVCPRWPDWVETDPTVQRPHERVETAMRYLGWSVHLVQDQTIPWHAANLATQGHQDYEDDADELIRDGKVAHLPLLPSQKYKKYEPLWNMTVWTVVPDALLHERSTKEYCSTAMKASSSQLLEIFFHGNEDVLEYLMDLSIKLTAAMLEDFFDRAIDEVYAMPEVFVDINATSLEAGSELNPFRAISQGVQVAGLGDTIQIAEGYYPEKLVIDKPCILKAWNGVAVIGQ